MNPPISKTSQKLELPSMPRVSAAVWHYFLAILLSAGAQMKTEPKSNTHRPPGEESGTGTVRLDVAVSIIQQSHWQAAGKSICSPTVGDNDS